MTLEQKKIVITIPPTDKYVMFFFITRVVYRGHYHVNPEAVKSV